MKIAHIVNILEIKPKHESSYLHIAQPVTLKSMLDAKLKSKNPEDIDLIAVKHKDDNIECPEGFRMARDLTRYCYDVFPELPKTRGLPLISDIFHALNQASEADYYVYTNIDIGLFPDFYDFVIDTISNGINGFTINKLTMHKKLNGITLDQNNYNLVFNQKGSKHSGFDCFIFPSTKIKSMKLGNVFIGTPPIGTVIKREMQRSIKSFKSLSSNTRKTFHLGNDIFWLDCKCPFYRKNIKCARLLGYAFNVIKKNK